MKREIKFRIWDDGKFEYIELPDVLWIAESDQACPSSDATIQQFTGLKDKNDKDIYEGDILSIPNNFDEEDLSNDLMTVEYLGAGWVYRDLRTNKCESIHSLIGFEANDEDSEIIGNIFENEEFLTK